MKKTLSFLLTALMVGSLLTACGGSGNEQTTKAPEQTTVAESTTATPSEECIQVTDNFSVSDPEGISYDKRIICLGDASSLMIQSMAMQGYNVDNIWIIIYAKDDMVVSEYQVIVCKSKEDADQLSAFYAASGQSLTQEEEVLYMYSDADMIQGTIALYVGMGALADEKVDTYVEFMKTSNGLVEQ